SRILEMRKGMAGPMLANPIATVVTALVPDFYGSPLRNRNVLPASNYFEQQVFAGIVTLVAAAMGISSVRHRRHYVFFACAAVVALLIMYGTPVASLAVRLIPPLAVTSLSRFGLVALGAASIMAAIGIEEWL